ncbi:hypothetical protein OP861_09180 [Yersinia intermedia]|uniref:hypothetical protein n=1 Tax=Yersinia intermedia TaxID=631 RepID=UPI00223FB93A|nr:hypothetical protein [Yersinia intermedia]UZM72792.1 hypothetical protein OP861_09180 [Yersinia intermedia]
MSTYGHGMISEIDDALNLIKYYTINGYSDSDIKNILTEPQKLQYSYPVNMMDGLVLTQ